MGVTQTRIERTLGVTGAGIIKSQAKTQRDAPPLELGGSSGAIEVRTVVPQSQTLDGYSEDDCVPRRDVDDADCARIISA